MSQALSVPPSMNRCQSSLVSPSQPSLPPSMAPGLPNLSVLLSPKSHLLPWRRGPRRQPRPHRLARDRGALVEIPGAPAEEAASAHPRPHRLARDRGALVEIPGAPAAEVTSAHPHPPLPCPALPPRRG